MSKIGTNLRTVLSLTLVMLMMGSVMVAELWTRMEKDVKHTTFVQTIIRKIGMKQKIVQRTTLAWQRGRVVNHSRLMVPQDASSMIFVVTITDRTGTSQRTVQTSMSACQVEMVGHNSMKLAPLVTSKHQTQTHQLQQTQILLILRHQTHLED